MKNNTASANTANTWSFTPASVTVNGRTFEAKYSLARSGDVYVFAQVCNAPIRVHVGTDMPMYADALAAAKAEAPKAAAPAPAPAPVHAPAPVQDAPKPAPAKIAKAAAKVQAAKADTAAGVKASAPKAAPAKAPKAAAPKAEAPKPAPAPAPVQDTPKPAPAPAPVGKPWIGTTITGKGWNIAFDEKAGRTRVLFQAQPTDAQKAAIENAGFFWSNALQSWNKKLTCKAYRAAQELAVALNALA